MHRNDAGYTAYEAVIWTFAGGLLVAIAFGIYSCANSGTAGPAPSAAATTTTTTGAPATTAPDKRWRIVYVECEEPACHESLDRFAHQYEGCAITPLGPVVQDGNTIGYNFHVTGGSK